jgi:hypothetical protein
MDLAKLPNPYDFANPVSDPDLFAGRGEEMTEVKYYLDHATRAQRAINLAIMGARASGKTSFLNMIDTEACKRGFCVIRVDLDEADIETQLALFYKLFDAIVTTVVENGAYGGLGGKTYDVYRDMMDAYEVPEDKTFCSLVFPIQYAKAMSRNNTAALISDTVFKRDLSNISEELKRPIAILIDECDVLAKSKVHLEKLRNIFMNTPGYMLVFTGTPALFPVMDDVFSPIVRQFKKINIGPFEERDDTQTCIRKPLEKLGITRPSEILDPETYYDISEIHNLSGGRPYEIQLICHVLFRRLQDNRAKRMELTLDVLDDVIRELQTLRNVSARKVLNAVRGLDRKELEALGVLCQCDGQVTFDQLWFAEYVFHGETRWTRSHLHQCFNKLTEEDIVALKDGMITFLGDDFDRIYCKYLARKCDVYLSISELPYMLALALNLDEVAIRHAQRLEIFPLVFGLEVEEADIRAIADSFRETASSQTRTARDPFESTENLADIVYWSSISFRKRGSFPVATVTVTIGAAKVRRWYGCGVQGECLQEKQDVDQLAELAQALLPASSRARELGGDLDITMDVLPVVPLDSLVKKVTSSGNQRMRENLALRHIEKMTEAYIEFRDTEEALFHGSLAYLYDSELRDVSAIDLGYLYLVSDDLEKARVLLTRGLEIVGDASPVALANYDLGVLETEEGHYQVALDRFQLTITLLSGEDAVNREMACLLVPTVNPETNGLEFPEILQPDLLEAAKHSIATINQVLQRTGRGD